MRLRRDQKNALLKWIATGLESGEINIQAAKFKPPFSVSRAQVDYYRHTRRVDLKELSKDLENDSLITGLSIKAERVRRLQLLAALMEEDIFAGVLWTVQVKMIGSGVDQERVEFEEFNTAEVQQYRGTLEDIAKELGGRAQKTEITGVDGKPVEITNINVDDIISRLLSEPSED